MFGYLVVALLIFSLLATSCEGAPANLKTSNRAKQKIISFPPEPRMPGEAQRQASIAGRAFSSGLAGLGYADPTTVFTLNNDSNIKGESLIISVKEDFIYKYYYVSEQGKWVKYEFPQQVIGNTNWITFAAGASVSTDNLPSGKNYVVAYSCSKTSKGFDCHGNKWQIHEFMILPISFEPQCGSDQECPTNYACVNHECLPKPPQQPPSLEPAPEVFNTKFYQSPVRADPDDLLLIPGYGFKAGVVVVYKQVSDKPANPQPPVNIPNTNTVHEGRLYVAQITTDAVTVLLPEVMKAKQTYAIWVKNKNSSWSEPVLINDPRPLWITPDIAYATKSFASLAREIKVVGRNLEDASAKIRLSGPVNYDLNVIDDGNPATTIEHYAAKGALPTTLQPGTYTIQFSRDGTNWIDLPKDIKLTVLADPLQKQSFDISTYGCSKDDGLDDTGCIVQAIAAAKVAGGGEVFFPAGIWELKDPSKSTDSSWEYNGIVVPQGVDLIGAGASLTKVVQTMDWKKSNGDSVFTVFTVFTLLGNNRIQGIYFHSDGFKGSYPLFIGLAKVFPTKDDPPITENIVIADNKFSGLNNGHVTGMYFAIGDWGHPVRRLFIAHNEFQAYRDDLVLAGGRGTHSVQDSVIAYNTFYPGDYEEAFVGGGAGTIASEMDGFRRSDFSDNIADGSVNGGWRATYFWAAHNANGPTLISRNKAICTGNKVGDGESFVFDANGDTWGFKTPQKVVAATSNSASVNGEWAKTRWVQADLKWIEELPGYYNEHWVNIVDGKGLGQTRKITGYQDYTQPGPWTFTVSPPWDVIPDSSSVVTVKRSNWNVYLVDNVVDNRGCIKSALQEKNEADSGQFGFWAEVSDWAIEGNRLYDSAGILALASSQEGAGPGINNGWNNFAGEIRNNLVDGNDKCPSDPNCVVTGGIKVWYGGPPDSPSVVQGYNLLISHNTVMGGASDVNLGGIAIRAAGYLSKITPYQWKDVLIFHNNIENSPSYGININEYHVWNTVLYKNNFKDNKLGEVFDKGTQTIQLNLFCGDSQVTESEVCDDGSAGKCAYGQQSCQVCSVKCDGQAAGITSFCGDTKCDLQYESTANCQQDCGLFCSTDTIISLWKGENDAVDALGKNKGIIYGGVTYATGNVGQAFSFDGINDYISVSDSPSFSSLSFSAAMWIKKDGNLNHIMTKGGDSAGWEYVLSGTSNPQISIWGNAGNCDEFTAVSSISLKDGEWSHVAFVYSHGKSVAMYVNGQKTGFDDTKDNTCNFVSGASNLNIGRRAGSTYFKGALDEITIWNKSLTDAEIQTIYAAGSKGICKA